jgi:hypothetical protein
MNACSELDARMKNLKYLNCVPLPTPRTSGGFSGRPVVNLRLDHMGHLCHGLALNVKKIFTRKVYPPPAPSSSWAGPKNALKMNKNFVTFFS